MLVPWHIAVVMHIVSCGAQHLCVHAFLHSQIGKACIALADGHIASACFWVLSSLKQLKM